MSELDTLLDAQLDDIADLPEFKPFPKGVHRVKASFRIAEDKSAIFLDFTYVENIEMVDPQEAVPNAGDTAGSRFALNNEWGLGNLKKCATPFGEALGCSSIRDIVEQTQGIDCAIVTSIRVDKNDAEKRYLDIKEIVID